MLLITGKMLKGRVPPVPYLRNSRAFVTCPINQGSPRKGLQLLSLFSTMYFDRRSTGAEVGRYERIVFLYSLSGVLFLFVGTVIFWSILGLVDSC